MFWIQISSSILLLQWHVDWLTEPMNHGLVRDMSLIAMVAGIL